MDFVFLVSILFAGLIDIVMTVSFIAGMTKSTTIQSKIADIIVVLAMAINLVCVYISFRMWR